MRKLRILTVCAEFAPLAKVGGLGDVTAGLSRYLGEQGHDVAVVLPRYGAVSRQGVTLASRPSLPRRTVPVGGADVHYTAWRLADDAPGAMVHLVDCPELFGGDVYAEGEREALRFMLLSRAALELCEETGFHPDIVHCHDWHAAPATVLLKGGQRAGQRVFRHTYAVLTIHNIGYQGVFPAAILDQMDCGPVRHLFPAADLVRRQVNLLKTGITHADALTTVSPTHAREIQTPEFGKGLDGLLRQRRHRLAGILNGADYRLWDPGSDPLIATGYAADDLEGKERNRAALRHELTLDADDTVPVVGFVSRLTEQKGVDIVLNALPALLRQRRFVCACLGAGERLYVEAMTRFAAHFPGQVSFTEGYDEQLAHRILAGSDLLLMPSLYEPCGLTQIYAMRYGTVPVVRETGGLADTVRHFDRATGEGTGSVFRDADVGGLSWGLNTALDWFRDRELWLRIVRNGMAQDFSWARQGPKYEELFNRLVAEVA